MHGLSTSKKGTCYYYYNCTTYTKDRQTTAITLRRTYTYIQGATPDYEGSYSRGDPRAWKADKQETSKPSPVILQCADNTIQLLEPLPPSFSVETTSNTTHPLAAHRIRWHSLLLQGSPPFKVPAQQIHHEALLGFLAASYRRLDERVTDMRETRGAN